MEGMRAGMRAGGGKDMDIEVWFVVPSVVGEEWKTIENTRGNNGVEHSSYYGSICCVQHAVDLSSLLVNEILTLEMIDLL